ncbi:MAG: hypothetical protein ACI9ZV_000471 [Candidatus Azotimanducaceae bacterium]|jgi:hypothetical protein
MRRRLLILMAVGLASVWLTTITFAFFVPDVEVTIDQPLDQLLPEDIHGWESRNVPLSSTPSGEERVFEVLRLDDYFSREYVRGDTSVMVYVAYWLPGSEPYSSVAIHNPDSCWVIAGWDVKERVSARKKELAGCSLKQHEWGIYEKNGVEYYVMFWHLLGGVPNEHIEKMVWTQSGVDSFKRQFYFVFNMFQMGLDLGRDQLFVRISSNKPFEELQDDPNFVRIIDHLRVLGIEDSDGLVEVP